MPQGFDGAQAKMVSYRLLCPIISTGEIVCVVKLANLAIVTGISHDEW
jgi:hypothetical protein